MNKMYRISYYPMSVDDIRSIFLYIRNELNNPTAAERTIKTIRKAVQGLRQMPERHQLVNWEPWHSMGIHQFPVGSYIIFYEVQEDQSKVNIVRIVYSGVDLGSIKC